MTVKVSANTSSPAAAEKKTEKTPKQPKSAPAWWKQHLSLINEIRVHYNHLKLKEKNDYLLDGPFRDSAASNSFLSSSTLNFS